MWERSCVPAGTGCPGSEPRGCGTCISHALKKEKTQSPRRGSLRAGSARIARSCRAAEERLCKSRERSAAAAAASGGLF